MFGAYFAGPSVAHKPKSRKDFNVKHDALKGVLSPRSAITNPENKNVEVPPVNVSPSDRFTSARLLTVCGN